MLSLEMGKDFHENKTLSKIRKNKLIQSIYKKNTYDIVFTCCSRSKSNQIGNMVVAYLYLSNTYYRFAANIENMYKKM